MDNSDRKSMKRGGLKIHLLFYVRNLAPNFETLAPNYCFCSLFYHLATVKLSLVSAPPRTPPPTQRAQPRARVRAAGELRGPRGLTAGQR